LLGWALRRLRHAATKPPKTSLATATGLAATSFVAASLGVVSIALTPAAPSVGRWDASASVNARTAAASTPAQLDQAWHARSPRVAATQTSSDPAINVGSDLVAADHHETISKNPTKAGTTADMDLTITTPVGKLVLNNDYVQHRDLTQLVCAKRRAC
jgi:hypothetical protein